MGEILTAILKIIKLITNNLQFFETINLIFWKTLLFLFIYGHIYLNKIIEI
jgi:hypothetical protein